VYIAVLRDLMNNVTLVVENMRGKMLQLWKSLASGEATVAQMILYPNAAALSKLEIPELLSLLLDIEKKRHP